MTSPKAKWIVAVLLLCAAWMGARWLRGGGDDDGNTEKRATRPRAQTPRMVFRDGRWERLDGAALRAFLDDLSRRPPGLMRISGTVRDRDSHRPVAAAEVVFAGDQGEWSTIADAGGRYTVEIAAGRYRAFARADGYVAVGTAPTERLPGGAPDASLIGVPRGELAPLIGVFRDQVGVDLHLHPGARITGTVYDTSGRPVAGAVVTGRLAGYFGSLTHLVLGTDMAESDLDGSFAIEVPAGVVTVTAVHADFAGLAEEPMLSMSGGASRHLDLTLAAGCIISGQVVDSRGEPAGDGSMELWTGEPPPNDYYPIGRIIDGRFRLTRTDSSRVRLRMWPWKSPPTVSQEFSCDNGTRYPDVTFVVPDAEPDLEGTVLSPGGEPVAGAFIDIEPLQRGGMAQQERADSYGEWAFYSLPPGPYSLTAYVPGHGVTAELVTVPSRGVRLSLGGTGAIVGTATGMQDGSLLFSVEHCLLPTAGGRAATFGGVTMPRTTRVVPVVNGAFRIDDVPACVVTAALQTPDGATRYIRVRVHAGQAAPVSIDLEPDADDADDAGHETDYEIDME